MSQLNRLNRAISIALLATLQGLIFSPKPALAQPSLFTSIEYLDVPASSEAQEPNLFALPDGRILVSWTQPANNGFAVMLAIGNEDGFTTPNEVVSSDDLFVNWADFPSVAAFPNGTIAAHWLRETGTSEYSYDVNISLSGDEGATWGEVLVPHRDATQSQHGFVTLLPVPDDKLAVIWLDARAYDETSDGEKATAFTNAMQLRTTFVTLDGEFSEDTALDLRTCTCCQTSAAITGNGTILVVYRDRTETEIRDISLIRMSKGAWSEPISVYDDGWEISGCPVNGPSIDANGSNAVVAWFTAANDLPAVNIAFSDNDGLSFQSPSRIDRGEAAGRVNVLQLEDGSAIVSWVEWTNAGEELRICLATPQDGCATSETIMVNTAPGSINFPRMVRSGSTIYIAWTQPGPGRDDTTTIRMVAATF